MGGACEMSTHARMKPLYVHVWEQRQLSQSCFVPTPQMCHRMHHNVVDMVESNCRVKQDMQKWHGTLMLDCHVMYCAPVSA